MADNKETEEIVTAEENTTEKKVIKVKMKPLSVTPEIVDFPDELGEAIEAIMFAAGHAVPYAVMARVLELPLEKTKQIIYSYSVKYNEALTPRGVLMLTFDDCCQLCTKQQYLPYIREALGIRRGGNLSNSSIETLAIIAYNQPVTRSYVDTVRGVDSSYAIGTLLERGLIEAKGRLDAPGRPMLYGTTPDFLRCFGLESIADLPGVTSEEAAEMLAKLNRDLAGEMPDKNQISIDADLAPEEGEPTPDATAVAIGETAYPDEE